MIVKYMCLVQVMLNVQIIFIVMAQEPFIGIEIGRQYILIIIIVGDHGLKLIVCLLQIVTEKYNTVIVENSLCS